ncbi:FAD-binding oxidoreductase [Parachitinimonas caeni]|uniref:FAD-binding oxidoreductase n=1 Tax=Parachitinimonas caeni TaxID=3031301 RepID=A0ABT7DW89_9NEIS|nr:FAD-binding oxidoreductase [Parachitinimonas caeni]MDK2122922.1 FAD-binding oxidoreductase [Parachitinimonas caeni]
MKRYQSWGRIDAEPSRVYALSDRQMALPTASFSMLPFGNGRSYGDVGLNRGGALLDTAGLDRFIDFDPASGILRCEAGVQLDHILSLAVPQGWFLPVTPGTRFVTVGGAIANDVHGKNHHVAGSFGCHVRQFELLRSDGSRRLCSPQHDADWFGATIGGLGLTGLITWAELQLRRIANPFLWTEAIRFRNLQQFIELDAEVAPRHEYTVAWLDCLAGGAGRGRGIYFVGDHAPSLTQLPLYQARRRRLPLTPPWSLVNGLSLRAFNQLYYHRPLATGQTLTHYEPYFYPLDSLLEWNRMYGPRGFYQYQCVVAPEAGAQALDRLLQAIARSGQGSFLAVLKRFGDQASPGWLSFPRPGYTLALDFPNRGDATLQLFRELDAVVLDHGGAIYPAKDATMPAEHFRHYYPAWQRFSAFVDPAFSSSLWRRVMAA